MPALVAPVPAGQRGLITFPIAGVTLLAVLVLITVSSILVGQAAESWDSQVRHELEETLIARGEEYRRAIELYYKTNARPPVKLEDLCPKERDTADVRYIRRCWKDPMTGKDFRTIGPAEVGKRKLANDKKKQDKEDAEGGAAGGQRDRRDDESDEAEEGVDTNSGPSLSKIDFSLPGQESRQQLTGDKPFVGVASNASDELRAFREFNGSRTYSEWEFVAVTQGIAPNPYTPAGRGTPRAFATPVSRPPLNPRFPTPATNPRFPTPTNPRFPTPTNPRFATPLPFPTPRPFPTPPPLPTVRPLGR